MQIQSASQQEGSNLCAIAEPPEIGEGPQLAGPHNGTDVDLFISYGDKGNSEMHMLHGA